MQEYFEESALEAMEICKLCVTKDDNTYHILYPPEPWHVEPKIVEEFSSLENCSLLHKLWGQELSRRGGPSKVNTAAEVYRLWTSTIFQCDEALEQLETKQMPLEEAIDIFSELYNSEQELKRDLSQLGKELHHTCNKPSRNPRKIHENISGLWQLIQLCTVSLSVKEFLQLFQEKLMFTGDIHPQVNLAVARVSYWKMQ